MAPSSETIEDSFGRDWMRFKGVVANAKQAVNECVTCAVKAKWEVNTAIEKINEKYPGRLRVARARDNLKAAITCAKESTAEVESNLKFIDTKWLDRPPKTRETLKILAAQAVDAAAQVELELKAIYKNWLDRPAKARENLKILAAQAVDAAAPVVHEFQAHIDGLSSDSELSDVPDDIERDPIVHGFQAYIDDFSSDSELSDVPDDIGPDPFIRDTQAQQEPYTPEEESYERAFARLKSLLARAKHASTTTSYVAQVETAAELDLAVEGFDKKWHGILPTLDPSLGESDDENQGEISSESQNTDQQGGDSSVENTDFPCPYASIYYCDVTFETERAAKVHSAMHTASSGRFLCPYAGLKCAGTFGSLQHAKRHSNSVHLKIKPFSCPHAREYNCKLMFSDPSSAKKHGRVHAGEKPDACVSVHAHKRSKIEVNPTTATPLPQWSSESSAPLLARDINPANSSVHVIGSPAKHAKHIPTTKQQSRDSSPDPLSENLDHSVFQLFGVANASTPTEETLARKRNDERLKRSFDAIYEKYGRDFADEGDEIDVMTGEILVDNGHIRSMAKDETWEFEYESVDEGIEEEEEEEGDDEDDIEEDDDLL
jgi:Centromere protein Scm3